MEAAEVTGRDESSTESKAGKERWKGEEGLSKAQSSGRSWDREDVGSLSRPVPARLTKRDRPLLRPSASAA